jgi:hypothetical protein
MEWEGWRRCGILYRCSKMREVRRSWRCRGFLRGYDNLIITLAYFFLG